MVRKMKKRVVVAGDGGGIEAALYVLMYFIVRIYMHTRIATFDSSVCNRLSLLYVGALQSKAGRKA